jgi:hypothetical protein
MFDLDKKIKEAMVRKETGYWEKEKENQLLNSSMQQLLPEIFEEKRIIPNCFLRGALFGMVRKGKRKLVENQSIFSMSQYEVFFSGSELDQNDLAVWDTLIYLAKERNIENELRVTLYDLCQQMRLTNTSQNREALIKRIERLKFCMVKIQTGSKLFFGNLINNGYIDKNGDGKLVIEYNKKLASLFSDNDYTVINLGIRHLLGDNQLARWLYNFYESHNQPLHFAIDLIKKLCRSESEPKEFRRLLKNALEMIKKAYLSTNAKSKWNFEITPNNYLAVYPKGKSKKSIDYKKIAHFF